MVIKQHRKRNKGAAAVESHPDDVNRLDGNISCDLHRANSLHRHSVLEGVEVVPVDSDLQRDIFQC